MIETLIGIILSVTFPSIICYMLIFKPMTVSKYLGEIYWRMGKITALGKSDETRKYFFTENPFWFRALGFVMVGVIVLSVLARLGIIHQ